MTTYHEPNYVSDVLLVEVAKGWTTQTVQVQSTQDLAIGTVLFQQDGESHLTASTSDYQKAVAVLLDNIKANEQAQSAVAIVRGAVVAQDSLIFPTDANDEQKKQSLQTLNALGIVAQTRY